MAYKIKNKKGQNVKIGNKYLFGSDHFECKGVDMNKRTLMLVGTDETKDRDKDIVTHKGWNFENFYKNPVFIWAHNYESVPLARVERIFDRTRLKRHDFLMRFPTLGLNPFADLILGEYDERIINASSVGFIPTKAEPIEEKEEDDIVAYGRPMRFLEKELLELSGCAVPSNPNAVQDSVEEAIKARGILYSERPEMFGLKSSDVNEIIQAYLEGRAVNLPRHDDLLEELHVKELKIETDKKKYYNNYDGKAAKGFESFVLIDDEEGIEVKNEKNEIKDKMPELEEKKRVGGAKNLALADEGMALKSDELVEIKDELEKLYEPNIKSGAVLSTKNMNLLSAAMENIQKVIDSAQKEEPDKQDQLNEPDKQGPKTEDTDKNSVYDVILEPKEANKSETVIEADKESARAVEALFNELENLRQQINSIK